MEQWKRNLFILCIGQFLVLAAMSSIIPFLPLYIQEMGVTEPEEVSKWAGIIFGVNFLSAFIFAPIWGKLADRYGRKMMVVRSGIGMAIVITLMGFATSPLQLLILRFINGTVAGFIPAAIALTATNTPKERVGYALGVLQSGAVAGSICGPLIGGLMADMVGFRTIFSYTGILIFIATLIVIFLVKESFERKEDEEKTSFKEDFKKIIAKKPILRLFIIGLIIQLATLGTLPIIPLFVQELSPTAEYIAFLAGLTGAVMGLSNMLSAPLLGRWGDRYGSHYILLLSTFAAALVTFPQSLVHELWQLILLRFLLGLCLGGMIPAVNAMIRHYAPSGMESRTYGYSNSAIFIGNMTGPIAAGYIGSTLGIRSIFIFAAILLFLNCIIIYSIIKSKLDQQNRSDHRENAKKV